MIGDAHISGHAVAAVLNFDRIRDFFAGGRGRGTEFVDFEFGNQTFDLGRNSVLGARHKFIVIIIVIILDTVLVFKHPQCQLRMFAQPHVLLEAKDAVLR